jgi:hypothetical protein
MMLGDVNSYYLLPAPALDRSAESYGKLAFGDSSD